MPVATQQGTGYVVDVGPEGLREAPGYRLQERWPDVVSQPRDRDVRSEQ